MTHENCYKIAIIGASGSGKSKYVKELTKLSKPNKNSCKFEYIPTIGVQISYYDFEVMDKNITFQLIEIAGDDHLRGNISNSIKNIDGAIIIIDERTTYDQYVEMINLLATSESIFPIINVFNRHSIVLLPDESLKPLINEIVNIDEKQALTRPIKTLYGKIAGYI